MVLKIESNSMQVKHSEFACSKSQTRLQLQVISSKRISVNGVTSVTNWGFW